ncbi:thioredoxin [Luedemannella helvata]
MATTELTDANFEKVTSGEGIVLIDFWADWCGPCKRFAPTYEKLSEKHPDIVFGKLDTEANPNTAREFNIRSIPTIMMVRDGVIVHSQAGALPESILEALIKQVRELDMDEIRAKLATA